MSFHFAKQREELRARVSVADVLSMYDVEVRRGGKVSCPFHRDGDTPNCQVYDDHVYCFSCRAYGDVFDLVGRFEQVGHADAVRLLAQKVGFAFAMKPDDLVKLKREERSHAALEFAADYYRDRLTPAHREYLLNRGVTEEQIAEVGFGSADSALVSAMLAKGFSADEICTPPSAQSSPKPWLGTTERRPQELCDFFWNGLLVVPMRLRGRVVGLMARRIDGQEPKCINLPGARSPFGLDALRRGEDVVLVEGPFDALALERHGFCAVALMGVSVDDALVDRLGRAKSVYVMLDGDTAGKNGALDVARRIGTIARIVVTPDGKDPDELGKADLVAAMTAARDVAGHLIATVDNALTGTALTDRIRESGLVDVLATDEPTRREGHLEDLRAHLGLSKSGFAALRSALKKEAEQAEKEHDAEAEREKFAGRIHLFEDGRIAEVVLSEDGKRTEWAIFDPTTGEIEIATQIECADYDLVPQSDPQVLGWHDADPFHPKAGLAVLLNGKPRPYGTTAQLFAEIRGFISRYFCEPDDRWLDLYAAYVLLTWALEAASECPYLAWSGGPGSGKTRAFLTVGMLCRLPMLLSAGSSAAAIRRTIDRWRGTMLADEGLVTDKTDAGAEILGFLLCGFSRMTATAQICEGDDNNPRAFHVFGPKLFTGQIEWRDPGARSRTLLRTLPGDARKEGQPVELPPEFHEEADALRCKLHFFRLKFLARFRERRGSITNLDPEFDTLLRAVPSRVQQVFRPLLRVVDDREVRVRLADISQAFSKDFEQSKRDRIEGSLMQAVAELMADSGGRSVRRGTAGRIAVKNIRWKMIGYAVASGMKDFEAEKSVPTPQFLGRMIKSTLGLRSASGRDGAYVVIEEEADLVLIERAMRNFGVELPWAVPEADAPPPKSETADTPPPPPSPKRRVRDAENDGDYVPEPDPESFFQAPEERDE